MALNIFPRRPSGATPATETTTEPGVEIVTSPEPATASASASADGASTPGARRTSRTSRQPSARSRRSRSTSEDEGEQEKPAARRSRGGGRTSRTTARDGKGEETATAEPEAPARTRRSSARKAEPSPDGADIHKLIEAQAKELERQSKLLDKQQKQLDDLAKLQRDMAKRLGDGASAKPLQRVGVFVDVANVELAAEKLGRRINWEKVLKRLSRDRQLVAAVAYSPVHEDLQVSLESQRFTEPFYNRGYRLVAKPLKKFSDGTVKANVDIEMTIEIMGMVDRLDVVCLVSGDGDFEPLVRILQERAIRVEVVSVGNATAMALKRAGDQFIDLASILNEVAV